jgi:hypothetical protein
VLLAQVTIEVILGQNEGDTSIGGLSPVKGVQRLGVNELLLLLRLVIHMELMMAVLAILAVDRHQLLTRGAELLPPLTLLL